MVAELSRRRLQGKIRRLARTARRNDRARNAVSRSQIVGALAHHRLRKKAGGMKKQKANKLKKPFAPMYIETITSPAWRSLPHGARSLYLLIKRFYKRKHQGPVYLSVRFAAKELDASRNTVADWLSALAIYGFVVKTERGSLGLDGKGKAALYRLTDEPFKGKPPTRDFLRWKNLEPVPKIEPLCSKTEPLVAQKLSHRPRKFNKQGGSKIGTHLEEASSHLVRKGAPAAEESDDYGYAGRDPEWDRLCDELERQQGKDR
jgi:hypothetical protein